MKSKLSEYSYFIYAPLVISKRLNIMISQLIDEKYLLLPSQYIIKKQDILKTLLHDDNTIKKIEDVFDEIHDLYYVDLPEEEQLAIEILQAIIDVHISNNPDFGEGLLRDYFFQVKLKETFSQNDLLLLQLYFNCIPFGEWDESEFNLLIKKTVAQVNYSLDMDLLLLNKVIITAEYGTGNRPSVRYFRPLSADKKSTKCGNNRPNL